MLLLHHYGEPYLLFAWLVVNIVNKCHYESSKPNFRLFTTAFSLNTSGKIRPWKSTTALLARRFLFFERYLFYWLPSSISLSLPLNCELPFRRQFLPLWSSSWFQQKSVDMVEKACHHVLRKISKRWHKNQNSRIKGGFFTQELSQTYSKLVQRWYQVWTGAYLYIKTWNLVVLSL